MRAIWDIVHRGIVIIAFGTIILVQHKFCHYAYVPFCWDFTGYSTPLGSALLLWGIGYICFDLRRWVKGRKGRDNTKKRDGSAVDKGQVKIDAHKD
jgi:hypothetical protein